MTEASRARVRALLGIGDPRDQKPSAVVLGQTSRFDRCDVQKLTFTAPDGHNVPALFLTPRNGDVWNAAVVAVHQHNGEFEWGKSEPAGLAGNARMAYACTLAASGVPTLTIDLSGFEERLSDSDNPGRSEQDVAWRLVTQNRTLQGLHTEDVALATNWLLDHPRIAGPIGIVGHSLGGQVTFFSMATDPLLAAGVVSCGIGTLESYESGNIVHNPAWYVPGLRSAGDAPIVAAAFHGQRVRVISGIEDPIFPSAGVRRVVDAFPAGVCEFFEFDGGHDFPEPLQGASLTWLASALRALPRPDLGLNHVR